MFSIRICMGRVPVGRNVADLPSRGRPIPFEVDSEEPPSRG